MEADKTLYSYLTEPFHDWIRTKLRIYYEELETAFFYGNKHKALLEELNLSEQEFYERFLKPYEDLSLEQLSKVASIQTELGYKYLKSYTHFLAKPVLDQYMNAIEWTVLNIADLHLSGLDVEPDSNAENDSNAQYLKELYNQCRNCGRPDKDPREIPFGQRQLARCKINDGDLENRECSKEWQKFFDVTRDKINTKSRSESINYFLKKCQERFEFNLENTCWTIGTATQRSKWIGPFIDHEKSYV